MMRRRTGKRADWVYVPELRLDDGSVADEGSYTNSGYTIVQNDGNAHFFPLYNSKNYSTATSGGLPGGVVLVTPSVSRSEGRNPLLLRVQGTMMVRPSTWAAGSAFRLGLRFVTLEQDPVTGSFLIPSAYAMWGTPNIPQLSAAVWANDRGWDREFRHFQTFAGGNEQSSWNFRFNFRLRRWLRPNFAYGIYCATDSTITDSVNIVVTPWFRTLVVDE